MAFDENSVLWQDGALVPFADAKVHVLTHALHYGSSIFEGVRVYDTPQGPCFFRLPCHLERFVASARVHRIEPPYGIEEMYRACGETVRANALQEAYVRPLLFKGMGSLGLHHAELPTHFIVAAVEWGALLGSDAREKGVDVCVSSWRRVAPGTLPVMAKAGGNYLAATLIHDEAVRDGYHEGIALNHDGTVAEGAGENIFLVRDGRVSTPPAGGGILPGITRHTAMELARRAGFEVREEPIAREALVMADEIFLTGTAAEITPVRSVDRQPVGDGRPGPVTRAVQDAFFGLFTGATEDRDGWLQRVEEVAHAS